MTFFDTHTHLYLPEFVPDGCTEAVNRAIEAGVTRMMLPNVDLSTVEPMHELHALFPEETLMAMGLHPTEVGEDSDDVLSRIREYLYLSPASYRAVGEIGIDLYWDKTFRDRQQRVFETQLNWATGLRLPVIIHCREGLDEALEVLSGLRAIPRAVFHSFGGTPRDVDRILSVSDSFYFGINGIVTFKNSTLRDTLPAIPLERLLLETDSPYLAPVPYRGKRNESAYMINTAGTVASVLRKDVGEIAGLTTANAEKLFEAAE